MLRLELKMSQGNVLYEMPLPINAISRARACCSLDSAHPRVRLVCAGQGGLERHRADLVGYLTGAGPKRFVQYMMAFQCFMAILTLATPDVSSTNTYERIFSIVFSVFGLIASSLLVSALLAIVVGAQAAHKDKTERLRQLRDYLRVYKVSASMALAVQKQACARQYEHVRLEESHAIPSELVTSTMRL